MYLVEGNIGAGKSTFLQLIKQQLPQVQIALEPVQTWYNAEHGRSLLQNFYTDARRWAYTMESFTLMHRIHENTKLNSSSTILAERSIYSGLYCFAQNSHANNFLSKLEWNLYQKLFDFLTNHPSYLQPAGFIYIQTTPEVAYERIIRRNRSAESLISLEYIKQIHHQHELLLLGDHSPLKAPILILDGNCDFENNELAMVQLAQMVQQFIHPVKGSSPQPNSAAFTCATHKV